MIGRTNKTLKMRVLLVDDDLGNPGSMRGRVLNELVEEFAERNAELIKAISFDDALAAGHWFLGGGIFFSKSDHNNPFFES